MWTNHIPFSLELNILKLDLTIPSLLVCLAKRVHIIFVCRFFDVVKTLV